MTASPAAAARSRASMVSERLLIAFLDADEPLNDGEASSPCCTAVGQRTVTTNTWRFAPRSRLGSRGAAPEMGQSANDPRQHRGYGLRMLVAVFGDAHAHAEAIDAVIAAAQDCAAHELWSLGDMIGRARTPSASWRGHANGAQSRCWETTTTQQPDRSIPGASENPRPRRSAPSSWPERAWPASTSSGCARAGRRRAATACSAGTAARATPSTNTSGVPTPQPAWTRSAKTSGSSATPTRRPPGNRPGRRPPDENPPRRPIGPRRRQVAAEPGRGRRADTTTRRMVGRPGPPGRRRRLLAAARPRPPHGDVAPRALRPHPRPPTRPRARARRQPGQRKVSDQPRDACSRLARTGAGLKRPLSPWRWPSTVAAAVPVSGKVPD